jgi:hypothetical protein
MSITIYDDSGIHILGSFADFNLRPFRGKNPYREKCEGEEEVGEYELYLVTDGQSRGYMNEVYIYTHTHRQIQIHTSIFPSLST